MKRFLTLLLALVMVLSQVGFAAAEEKTIVIQTYTDNGNLNPYVMNTNAQPIFQSIYEPLWRLKPDYNAMLLATEIVATEDPTHNVIKLREGVTFSNGSEFKANDVIFSLKTNSESPTGSYYKNLINFDKTAALDDYTVDLWFNNFDTTWQENFSSFLIVDEETYDEQSSVTLPIGTGPYTLVSYTVGVGAELAVNPTYWGGQPDIQKVIIKEMDEDTQVTTALETGELDVSYLAPTADLWYLDDMEQFDVFVETISKSNLMLFDMTEGSPFVDVRAREAAAYAIANDAIIKIVFQGLGTLPKSMFSTADPMYRESHSAINPIYSKTTSDIEKAHALLEEAGLLGSEITIAVQSTPTYKSEAEVFQANLLAAGFGKVNILAIDNSSYYTALGDTETWDIAITGMTSQDGTGLHTFYNLFTSTMAYLTMPDEDAFMAQINDAFATADAAEREAKMYTLTEKIINECLMYNIFDISYGYVYSTDVENFKVVAGRYMPIHEFKLK